MQTGEAKALHTRDLKSGVDLSDPTVEAEWERVRDDAQTDATWVLLR
jgi:hypothetical protein